jgi:hypothetical protein
MTERTRRGRKSDVLERLAEQQQERLSQRETPVDTRATVRHTAIVAYLGVDTSDLTAVDTSGGRFRNPNGAHHAD